uniref:Mannosyltransferase n=1 Tax=Culex tarsalis TaxID=7177 RepID=A0A1Q3G447_CULTA
MVFSYVFGCLFLARLISALFLHISDCDETYNYWEPVHYLLYGKGFQTWEYSPEYGLRSYLYLLLHAAPAWIIQTITGLSSTSLFYCIRVMLAAVCSVGETVMFRSIKKYYDTRIAIYWFIFQLFCPGMFISSTAFLPSSFSMFFTMLFYSSWLRKKVNLSILSIAISSLLGWPFAALISLPFLYSTMIHHRLLKVFLKWTFLSALLVGVPLVAVDSYYYGKLTVAPMNIILYNVFTSHGPNIFGVEPLSFYFMNLFLNFNIVWCLVLCYPIVVLTSIIQQTIQRRKEKTMTTTNVWNTLPAYIWMVVFFIQPHKEERFLFPIYPLLTLCAALCLVEITRMWRNMFNGKRQWLGAIMFVVLSLSRIFALYIHYRAPMEIATDLELGESEKNVCIGKEWHRIPGNFFMPKNYHVRFVQSNFNGILPAYFDETEKGTTLVHSYFNDLNLASDYMLFNITECDYLIDSDFGQEYLVNDMEPNYTKDNITWEIVTSKPFLDSKSSSNFFRAFYVPLISSKFTKFGNYNLLKRRK